MQALLLALVFLAPASASDSCGRDCAKAPARSKPRTISELVTVLMARGSARGGGCLDESQGEAGTFVPCYELTYSGDCAGDGRFHTVSVLYTNAGGKKIPTKLIWESSLRESDGGFFSMKIVTTPAGKATYAFTVPGPDKPASELDLAAPNVQKLIGMEKAFHLEKSVGLPFMGRPMPEGACPWQDPW
jgi:hypothetical protein